jgi:hypothetical protein
MLVLSTNLIIYRCIDLGSIKLSLNKTSGSINSEFTCCSNSFARALVIGPILISLDFFAATSLSSIGAGDNGGVIGMSSSLHQTRVLRLEFGTWCNPACAIFRTYRSMDSSIFLGYAACPPGFSFVSWIRKKY